MENSTVSAQIIEVLEYLGEKFGMAIDWTSENVWPYIEDLLSRLVTYNIVQNIIEILIGILFIVGAVFGINLLLKYYKQSKKTTKDNLLFWRTYCGDIECEPSAIIFIIGIIVLTLMGASLTVCCTIELVRWIIIPELQLISELSTYISQLGV